MKALLVVLAFLLGEAISYGITVGIIYLICMCFSWEFDVLFASGIWLVMGLLRTIFSGGK